MMLKRLFFVVVCSFFTAAVAKAQPSSTKAPAPVYPIPSPAQMAWHQMEMNAFVHFTTNTFTGKEWGYGDEDKAIFNPTALDAGQWAKTLKETGFKMLILTCKHHDGFCLWPSKHTEHSVKNSPYKNGKGDVVKEAADAAKKYGLKFGVYLSPWDRNHPEYGRPGYVSYYRNQLRELFTQYGTVTEMWFDGANGGDGYYGGSREARKIDGKSYYDWPNTLKLITGIQPKVLFFSDAGPHLRWVGNESGVAGLTNWNCLSPDTVYAGKSGIEALLNRGDENGSHWIPAETDVSIRPGWFFHEKENDRVKTPEQLFDIYLTSVGRGSTLLLNIPPDQRGLFHEKDVQSLYGLKELLKKELGKNLAYKAKTTASTFRGKQSTYAPANLTDGQKQTYWATDDGITSGSFEVDLGKPSTVKYVMLQEYIELGQRVKSFAIEAWQPGGWKEVATGTTIGYKRILKIEPLSTQRIRVTIKDAKASPVISNVEVF
ncbi:MAG: glycoside hydrolase family 29 [Bacteroidetes bacterium]|nr:MAG: glycoside hydrolase family 29 [Bacteroidota bacterium]